MRACGRRPGKQLATLFFPTSTSCSVLPRGDHVLWCSFRVQRFDRPPSDLMAWPLVRSDGRPAHLRIEAGDSRTGALREAMRAIRGVV
mmetsp:Transcript_32743/g.93882  ORF Transcript_32743/g.93882 Transcript_32743/m.93882 type:complete len:88 (-) Transcript_32743:102-365(-)